MTPRTVPEGGIVITGASSGFGRGAALRFAEEGASLVLAARRGDVLEEVARECERLGGKALPVETDVSRREDVAVLAEAALNVFGGIGVWINDAGVGALGRFERIPIEVQEQLVATDLLGCLYGSWYAYRQFLKQGRGVLINVASELGRHTLPYYSAYTAAKHGVVGLTESLRQEIAENGVAGVHACLVLPAAHDTPFFDHAANYTGHEVTPPKPLHDPADVVETLVRLAKDPRDSEIVGADGLVKILAKRLMPRVEDRIGGRYVRRTQMEKPPPAGDFPGAVTAPMPEGTGVSAGRRE